MDKPKCEAQTLMCSGMVVRKVKGLKKKDPEFHCCIACRAILERGGTRLREVS